MNKDRSSKGSLATRWLERLVPGVVSEPRDRKDLIALLKQAKDRALFDTEALAMLRQGIEAQFVEGEQESPEGLVARRRARYARAISERSVWSERISEPVGVAAVDGDRQLVDA